MSAARRHLNIALGGGVAILVFLWLAHVPGIGLGLEYLSPAIFVVLLLWLGRYPGEALLIGASKRAAPARRRPARHRRAPVPGWRARGGLLLAMSLAGRAPPVARATV
ncbi:MAG TPA: hypothetical protein VMB05_07285 [Solirubrobacteraceae bacterium]|nr:hypothetical protein [Solirubrobacteraceae bacterium]